jgi:hypothetical protein
MLICAACGNPVGKKDVNFNPAVKDGVVCALCAGLCDNYQIKTVDTVKSYREENFRRAAVFKETKVLKNFFKERVAIDSANRLFFIGKPKNAVYYAFNEVREFGNREVGSIVNPNQKSVVTRIFALVITLEMYSGKKTVYVEKPPKGFTEFLADCLKSR